MTSKPMMKGIFKGFKYISHIFEEEKKEEIQIGFPTDVKHVAHIGWDGPMVESPAWMKEFNTSPGFQSAPLGDPKPDPEIKWVSEDSNTRRSSRPMESPGRDLPDVPRSNRRHQSTEGTVSSPKKKDSSTRSRQRRNHSKDSSEGSVRSHRRHQESSDHPSDSPSPGIPDPAKKARRKKSREQNGEGGRRGEGSTRSRSKPTTCGDARPDKESITINSESPQLDPIATA